MSTQGAYKRIDDGLVLQFDPANIKCFRGEPTSNILSTLYPYLDSATNWINSGNATFNINETDIEKPKIYNINTSNIRIVSAIITQSPCNIHVGPAYVPISTLTVGTTYTISIWFRQNKAGAIGSARLRTINDQFLNFFTYNGSNDTSIWPVNKWIKITATNIYPVGGNGGLYLSSYMGGSVGDKVWYFAPQLEAKDHSTHFINGIRGTTVATGGGLIDLSNNQNHGELINGLLYDSNKCGSLIFDGVNDYIKTTNTLDLSNTNVISVSFWLKTNINSGIGALIESSYNFNGTNAFGIFINEPIGSGKLIFSTWNNGYNIVITDKAVNDNLWHNVIFINTRGSGQNQTICYIDGVLSSTTFYYDTYHNENIMGNYGNYNMYIGGRGGSSLFYLGNLSNVMIWNRALKNDEIIKIYNQIKSRYL